MSSADENYQEKLGRERRLHTERIFRARHFLNSRLFFSAARNDFNYAFARRRLAGLASDLAVRMGVSHPKILIAPLGSGFDVPFLATVSPNLTGIDISPEAIAPVPASQVNKIVGDMRHMETFANDSFDLVVSSLFYHHFLNFGFDVFLKETLRVLRPGGYLIAMEPSAWHPVHWATWLGRKLFGNITGTLEDEAPFWPGQLKAAMLRCGFHDVHVSAASFSHHRVAIWLAKVNNALTVPLATVPVIRNFAWTCLFYGQK